MLRGIPNLKRQVLLQFVVRVAADEVDEKRLEFVLQSLDEADEWLNVLLQERGGHEPSGIRSAQCLYDFPEQREKCFFLLALLPSCLITLLVGREDMDAKQDETEENDNGVKPENEIALHSQVLSLIYGCCFLRIP